jgi:hypothetical protein
LRRFGRSLQHFPRLEQRLNVDSVVDRRHVAYSPLALDSRVRLPIL